jgi:hypothetical protein
MGLPQHANILFNSLGLRTCSAGRTRLIQMCRRSRRVWFLPGSDITRRD